MEITALSDDLMFGSRVAEGLKARGNSVTVTGEPGKAREEIGDVLIVDLTAESYDGVRVVEELSLAGRLDGVRTVGVYAHVDAATRDRAVAAGFDLVVPRSRFVREMRQLVRTS